MNRRPRSSTLFPYTTLFRSALVVGDHADGLVLEFHHAIDARPALGAQHLVLDHGDPRVVVDLARGQHRGRRSEEHTSELQSQSNLVCRLLLEKKKEKTSRSS